MHRSLSTAFTVLFCIAFLGAALMGCPPPSATVPNVTGLGQAAAETAITDAGLTVGTVSEASSDTVPAGNVISQSPAAGSSVSNGSAVDLVVSTGAVVREASFTSGTEMPGTDTTIGVLGGTVTGDAGTPVEGVALVVPAGAFDADTTVNLGYNTGQVTVSAGTASGIVLDLDTGGTTVFAVPVEVTFPYAIPGSKAAHDSVPVPYYIDEDGGFHLVTLVDIDPAAGTATFETFHASLYTWVLEVLGFGDESFTTAFRSSGDGFQIVNFGSTYNPAGECFGMSGFALWYHDKHSASSGGFYPRFAANVGTSGLKGQDIIATRAHNSLTQEWSHYSSIVLRQEAQSDLRQQAIVRNALKNTLDPVMIYLANAAGAHAVLAYAFAENSDQNRVDFSLYDPNFPNQINTMNYNTSTAAWNTYRTYTRINYMGDGSLRLKEPFTSILEDAEAGFHSDNDAVITVNSHESGDEVSGRSTTLIGTIESGEILVTELTVFAESSSFKLNVGTDGNFSQVIPIQLGTNVIKFQTKGNNASGTLILVENNMSSERFTLEGTSDQAVMLVTLSWDKDDTDVDLYVIDPTGDFSAYYNLITADGGELDVDDVDGFGPEHWTLTYEDTIRWGGDYDVRLHYYSDHGNGPTNYTVTILLYEGVIGRQEIATYRGTLSANDSGNDQPLDTGADWVNIATVNLTEEKGLQQIFEPSTAPITLTAPVPDEATRDWAKAGF